jgi:hypothetical protein
LEGGGALRHLLLEFLAKEALGITPFRFRTHALDMSPRPFGDFRNQCQIVVGPACAVL